MSCQESRNASRLANFPPQPGVYLMKDKAGRVLYVGKAKNLRQRVAQYFRQGSDSRYHISFLMRRVARVDFIVTAHEQEALLLENSLIKKARPRYNLHLKDDKSYPSIKVTIKHDFPTLSMTRKIVKDGSLYFGPYTSAFKSRQTLDFIDRSFKLRTCSDREFKNRSRPCLEYQIGRCDAPCVGKIDHEHYRRRLEDVLLFLRGQKGELQELVYQRMLVASSEEHYEEAAYLRDLHRALTETIQTQSAHSHFGKTVDVIGLSLAHDEDEWTRERRVGICLVHIEAGQINESLCATISSCESGPRILSQFIMQHYQQAWLVPPRIILPYQLPDQKLIATVLSEMKGLAVNIGVVRRGLARKWLAMAQQNAFLHLGQHEGRLATQRSLMGLLMQVCRLHKIPQRIECYDVSHLKGRQAVAAMVTFIAGQPDRSCYRAFNMRATAGLADDYAMMREVLARRFAHLATPAVDPGWAKPDLIVLDGGKGQLAQAVRVLAELNVTGVGIVAIAKAKIGPERKSLRAKGDVGDRIYLPGRKDALHLFPSQPALQFLQRVRDEAHRFAIKGHRRRRLAADN